MLESTKIGFIGAGNMATAIMSGLVRTKTVPPGQITASDIAAERLAAAKDRLGINVSGANRDLVRWADVLVLAVKPQVLDVVLAEIAPVIPLSTLVVSIVGGTLVGTVEEQLPGTAVVRVMPNTPAAVGQGFSVLVKGRHATADHLTLVQQMFQAVGQTRVINESAIDVFTAVSGCGPAYAYVIIDAMADAGVTLGLSRDDAILAAAQTLLGAAAMIIDSGQHPARLRDAVCTPGGITIAGVCEMEHKGVRSGMIAAIIAGYNKSRQMARVAAEAGQGGK